MSAPTLIPRRLLFGNASRIDPTLSLDGHMLSWLAPVDDLSAARVLTRTTGRPIAWQRWSADGRFILFFNDANGDENWRLHAVDPSSGALRELTPDKKVNAQALSSSPDHAGTVIVGLNDRDPSWHDAHAIDLATGERSMVFENRGHWGRMVFDWQGRLRLLQRRSPEQGAKCTG
jgi:Tol biopolymer transport system component